MAWLKTACVGGTATLLAASAYGYFSGNAWFYRHVAMPAVRMLDPEQSHMLAVYLASKGLVSKDRTSDPDVLRTELWGRTFSNPIGLAAGFDKHGEAYPGLLRMGFAFVEIGSVTPLPQAGNPKPRVFRLPEDDAIINSDGHVIVKNRLKKWKSGAAEGKVLGVNLGKNKDSKNGAEDYVAGIRELGCYADYIVINISSPNTPGLRDMQGKEQLTDLLDTVTAERDTLPHKPPLLVKVAPDLSDADKEDIADVILRPKGGADGLIVCNTTVTRPQTLRSAQKCERGGLSGAPLRDLATSTISDMYRLTKGSIPIIGVGGVFTGKDAYDKIAAGATLVEIYTSMVYEGPPVVKKIKSELAAILKAEGYSKVNDAVGTRHKQLPREH
ncbi:hypothetical protein EMCRGX_G030906 [Ephydatia muelleri]